jgi:lipopolysaccharide export system permease protein
LWFREGNRFIHIDKIHGTSGLDTVYEYNFDDNRRIRASMQADSAVYSAGRWQLEGVRKSLMRGNRMTTELSATGIWNVEIDPGLLRLSAVQSESLSSFGLWEYASYLDGHGLDADDYWTEFWRKLTMPLTIIVMSLFAIPFVVGSLRSSGNGQRLFFGIILGIGFFLLNEIVGSSGQVYGLQPWATAMLPTLLVGVVALFWLERVN